MSRKSLILAWILNILPGIGLIYTGNTGWGVFLLIIGLILIALIATGIGAIVGLPLYFLVSLIACIASVMAASKHNKQRGL